MNIAIPAHVSRNLSFISSGRAINENFALAVQGSDVKGVKSLSSSNSRDGVKISYSAIR